MNEWIEQRTEAIRLSLRISDFPNDQDLWRLVDWLGDTVEVRTTKSKTPSCTFWGKTHREIALPQTFTGRKRTAAFAHELGHVLLTMGVGDLLRQANPASRRIESLARAWDYQDEGRANYFVRSWFLPSAVVARYEDRPIDLAEDSNADHDLINQRLLDLDGEVVTIEAPPAWCAHWRYHAVADPESMSLWVLRKGQRLPAYVFPISSRRDVEEGALQTSADILALTPEEFEAKYSAFRREIADNPPFDIKALYDWSRRVA